MTARPISASGEVAVVVVAAGRGERAGRDGGPKQYRELAGKAVIAHTLERFLSLPGIGRLVVAIHADDRALFAAAAGHLADQVTVVIGGASRQASTLGALEALATSPPQLVLIHDAARPFASADLIQRVIQAASETSGAVPALAVTDTLKRSGDDGLLGETVAREGLFAAQTPQAFPFAPILDAHRRAAGGGRSDFTDDASIAEWAGLPVRRVEGSADNIKLTWARDFAMASHLIGAVPDIRVGNGYDVHAFEPGESVTLCGVAIPYPKKLSGHSDADVPLHALTDALLATCGAGDIGTHFPPSDPQWKGAASRIFVEHAVRLIKSRGGVINNVDITMIAEGPRIGPHRTEMVEALQAMLGIAPDRISVKATTNERLGFVGREEGLAAIATATVVFTRANHE